MKAVVLCVASLVCPAASAVLRGNLALSALVDRSAASLAAVQRLEAEDAQFWSHEYKAMQAQVQQLAQLADGANSSDATKTSAHSHHDQHMPDLTKLSLNPTKVADLVPALAMLKGLYEDGKQRIAKLNEREEKFKKQFAAKEAEHNARLAKINSKNNTLSAEFRANETKDEMRMFTYWARCRERQHRQYHTGLKIQHATLSKVKKMIDMYEKTMSGKDSGAVKKQLEHLAAPTIVFLQEARREVATFCRATLTELQEASVATSMHVNLYDGASTIPSS
eukprot:TRINITY_DN10043_c0_g3_i1.p1 TRINITY_DN10043_c0_g3~~TRINITY_DN10043_c0_g3_i1.p1  ORF type:complete len:314 (-),score=77.38 TRINITY_DN10043_c0_g3_i1:199-1035(-)